MKTRSCRLFLGYGSCVALVLRPDMPMVLAIKQTNQSKAILSPVIL